MRLSHLHEAINAPWDTPEEETVKCLHCDRMLPVSAAKRNPTCIHCKSRFGSQGICKLCGKNPSNQANALQPGERMGQGANKKYSELCMNCSGDRVKFWDNERAKQSVQTRASQEQRKLARNERKPAGKIWRREV